MLDTDYPYFPPRDGATPTNFNPSPLANLGGLTHCFLAMPAKKRGREFAHWLFSRLKMPIRTRVRAKCDLSRGDSNREVLG